MQQLPPLAPSSAAPPQPRTGEPAAGRGWAAAGRYLLLAGLLLIALAALIPSLNQPLLHYDLVHIVSVFTTSSLGVLLALLVLRVAQRARDMRMFLVGMGFLSIASMLMTHALATPRLMPAALPLASGLSALLSLVLGAIFFALSGLNLSVRANSALMRAAWPTALLLLAGWLVFSWVMLTGGAPGQAAHQLHSSALPLGPGLAAWLVRMRSWLMLFGLACYCWATLRHAQLYRQTPSQFGLALTCGIALFGEALVGQHLAQPFSALFWAAHAQEIVGFGAISYATLAGQWRGLNRESVVESVLLAPTRARLQSEYRSVIEELMAVTVAGDRPSPALRAALRQRLGMADQQVQVFERVAQTVAEERRQRRELERLNATLRQLEQHKADLTQMVVHDLKNPLTAMIGYLEILSYGAISPDQELLLGGALRSGKQLTALIGDLLDIARMEEGRFDLELSGFAVQHLLHECADELGSWLAQERKVAEVIAPAESLLAWADLRLLRRVLLNLVSNAIKHTPAGTRIQLRAVALPAGLLIEVEDNGPGIPPDQLDQIFERFRGAAHQTGRQTSTGLGLTFCRMAVEAHGGSIAAANVPAGGAIFRIFLPSDASALATAG